MPDVWIVTVDGFYVGTLVAETSREAIAEAYVLYGQGTGAGLRVRRVDEKKPAAVTVWEKERNDGRD
jgi:hypothetical protein